MPPAPRAAAALVCVAAVAITTGCSSGSGDAGTTTTARTPLTTASPERVRAVGALHLARVRPALAAEHAACGRDRIAPAPASIRRCRDSLARLSTTLHDFARALVFLRPAPELEPVVADSIDAARPVIDVVRLYLEAECLGATPPSPSVRSSRCAPAGREVAEVIAQLEQTLDRWKTELGVGK
jgi:hypothetical protein